MFQTWWVFFRQICEVAVWLGVSDLGGGGGGFRQVCEVAVWLGVLDLECVFQTDL